jgi:hypothetical protein
MGIGECRLEASIREICLSRPRCTRGGGRADVMPNPGAVGSTPTKEGVSVVVSDLPAYFARGLRLGWMERSHGGERGSVAG